MNKKIIAAIMGVAIVFTSVFALAGCKNGADRKKEEWKAAWEASMQATNYSCKHEYFSEENVWTYDEVKFESTDADYDKKDFKAYIKGAEGAYEAYAYFKSGDNGYSQALLQTFQKYQGEEEWTVENGCNIFLTDGYYVPKNVMLWLCAAGKGNGGYPENYGDKYEIEKLLMDQIANGSITQEQIDTLMKQFATIGLPAEMYDYFEYDPLTDTYTATLFRFSTMSELSFTVSFDDGKLKTFILADGEAIIQKTTFYDYGTTEVTIPKEISDLP